MNRFGLVCGAALLAGAAVGQPISLNTTLRSFTPVAGVPWIAGVFGYRDASGDYALICRGDSGLDVWDITNPAAPVLASHINATGSDLKEVKVFQNYAYCVQQSGPVLIVNLANPYAATVVNTVSGSGHTCFVADGHLYFSREGGGGFDGLEMWSLANPTAPALVGTYDPPSFCAHDTFAEGNLAFVSNPFGSNTGTHVVDITNRANPVLLSVIPHGGIAHSSYMYTAPGGRKILCLCNEAAGGRVTIVDVTAPAAPVQLGIYQTSPTTIAHNPWVIGRYLYVAYYQDYLRIVDLANPAQPVEVGVYDPDATNTGGTVFGVYGGAWGVYPITPTRCIMSESFIAPTGFYVVDWTPPPAFDLAIQSPAPGAVTLTETGGTPGTLILNGLSPTTTLPMGTGTFAGLFIDVVNTLAFPVGTQPFAVLADATGSYSFSVSGLPAGISFDLRGGTLVGGNLTLTPIARMTL